MKLKGISSIGGKIQEFLLMKRLTYIKRFFPVMPSTVNFAREENSFFTS